MVTEDALIQRYILFTSVVYAVLDLATISLTSLVLGPLALNNPLGQLVPTAILLSLGNFLVVTLLYVPIRRGRLALLAIISWVVVTAIHAAVVCQLKHPSDPSTLYSLYALESLRLTLPTMAVAVISYTARPFLGQITCGSSPLQGSTTIAGLFISTTTLAIAAAFLVNTYHNGVNVDTLSIVVACTLQTLLVILCLLMCLSDHWRIAGVVSMAILVATATWYAPAIVVTTVGRSVVAGFLLTTVLLTCGPMVFMRTRGFRLRQSFDGTAK